MFSGGVRVPSSRRSIVDPFEQAFDGFPGRTRSDVGAALLSVELAERVAEERNVISGYARQPGLGLVHLQPKPRHQRFHPCLRRLGMAGKILFPIPERGLAGRLYRIKAKTVVIWGACDRLIPIAYAYAFQHAIPSSHLVVIPEAGHMAPFEKTAEVVGAIEGLQ